jgi:predicted O-methyltransferase YrrM
MTIDEFNQIARAFQESRALLTALELDVFTAVGKGSTAPDVAARIRADPRATTMLLDALVALGAVRKHGGIYSNGDMAARHLVTGSPADLRPGMLHVANMWQSWSTLTDAVRQGTSVLPPGVEHQDPAWTEPFIAAMHQRAIMLAGDLVRAVGVRGARQLLDVGGGSGAFSIAFAQADPSLRAVVFDTPTVTPIAARHIAAAGLADRISTRNGDLRRDDLGAGYDLVLLSAICHMLGVEENRDLIRRANRATAPGGRLVIRDFLLDPDRTSPRQGAVFALNMLVATRQGSTYTEDEYRGWLASAGYDDITRIAPDGDILVARRPS